MPGVVRRGHVNVADQSRLVIQIEPSEATAAAVESAIEPAVTDLQAQLDELVVSVEGLTTDVNTLTVELPRGRRSGSLIVEPEGGFTDDQVGAPVLVTPAPNQGAIETVLFAAEVLNLRQMRLHWSAPGPAPSRVVVNYVIGSR